MPTKRGAICRPWGHGGRCTAKPSHQQQLLKEQVKALTLPQARFVVFTTTGVTIRAKISVSASSRTPGDDTGVNVFASVFAVD
eukprot:COSAG06_NODE_43492_length_371_cov_1.253676_1_plen_82_part_10